MYLKEATADARYYAKNKTSIRKKQKLYRNKTRMSRRVYEKQYWATNPDKQRAKRLKYEYGLTIEAFDSMLTGQNKLCALCHKPFELSELPVVDHNHTTGKVRGLIHNRCNLVLGWAKDDPILLKDAADYLTKNEQ